MDSSINLDMHAIPPEVKERIIRLQHENKMLKLARGEAEEEQALCWGQLLQGMLDDANARKNEFESEVRILNQRCLELSAQVENMAETERQAAESTDTEAAG